MGNQSLCPVREKKKGRPLRPSPESFPTQLFRQTKIRRCVTPTGRSRIAPISRINTVGPQITRIDSNEIQERRGSDLLTGFDRDMDGDVVAQRLA